MNTREQFGKYLLLKKLTEDPLGETFRAGMLGEGGMERVVLLRVFNGQGIDGPRLWQATQGRTQIPHQLRNPNIGEGVEMGEIEGLPYVAYDYISGKNMANLLAQAAKSRSYIPAEHALLITERVALALAAASESRLGGERILHGFLSPHLVMISNEGETRLLGFEVAPGLRTFAANPVIRQHFGRYLAPEALGGQPPHPSDDIFSLGVLLYELLTGRPLPPPAPGGFTAIIEQGLVATEGTPIPAELQDLLMRSLVNREHRIGDVGSWHKTLNKLMFDGQYSPTTFNLAFFMHNLFRQEIEQESQEIEIEKTLPLPTVKRQPPVAPLTQPIQPLTAGAALAGATAVGDGSGVREGTGVREATGVTVAAETGPGLPPEDEPKKSKMGLILAAAAVLLLLLGGSYWWWSGQRSQTAEIPPPPPPPKALEPPPPTGPTEEELNARIKDLITEQATEMEDELRKEYDQQLEALQSQLNRAKREAETRRQRELELEAERQQQEEAEKEAQALAEAQDAEAAAEGTEGMEGAGGTEEEADEPTAEMKIAEAEPPAEPPVVEEPPPPPAPPPPRQAQVRRGDLVEMGPGVTPPKLLRRPNPRFPEQARRLNRRAAKVIVRALVDENGKVTRVEVVGEKAGYGFDAEAMSTAKRSLYSPATKNGVPVKIWHNLSVEFRQ